jgi:sugar O-acyltransferase (sialic acid O-acetyltransferase NeuD family)
MKDKQTLYILGAGGHGIVIAEIASDNGYDICFCDDDSAKHGQTILKYPVVGACSSVPKGSVVALGVGDVSLRETLFRIGLQDSWNLPVLIHPRAVVSHSSSLGVGTVVMANAVINARSVVGWGGILNTSCSVDHDCRLGNLVHICPGAHLAGNVHVGNSTLVGVGSSVRDGVRIGERVVIGAGSVVVGDIPDGAVAYGNPARVVR